MTKKVFTAIGLMSGTSMDGIDLFIIKSDGYNEYSSIFDTYFEFQGELRLKLINLRNKIFEKRDLLKYSEEISLLENEITIFHSQIVNKILKEYNHEVDLIGFHGQTIFHDIDKKISKQIGDGNLLSRLTKK